MRKLSAYVFFAGLLSLSPAYTFGSAPAAPPATKKTEVGYVVSASDAALTLSNIPTRSSSGAPVANQSMTFNREGKQSGSWSGGGPGGAQVQLGPGDVVTNADGTRSLSPEAKKRFTPEQQKRIEETLKNQSQSGGPVFTQFGSGGLGQGNQQGVQIGPGDVVTNADGTRSLSPEAKKRLTPEQQKRVEEALKNQEKGGSGGPMVFTQPGKATGSTAGGAPAASAPSNVPLQIFQFVVEKKTKKMGSLNAGDKVKVTYEEKDGKKVATRIEPAK